MPCSATRSRLRPLVPLQVKEKVDQEHRVKRICVVRITCFLPFSSSSLSLPPPPPPPPPPPQLCAFKATL